MHKSCPITHQPKITYSIAHTPQYVNIVSSATIAPWTVVTTKGVVSIEQSAIRWLLEEASA